MSVKRLNRVKDGRQIDDEKLEKKLVSLIEESFC